MSLNRVDDLAEVARRRERFLKMAEGQVEEAVGAALRQFLRRILDATRPGALTAAAGPPRPVDLFTLGELNVWWQDAVDEQIVDAVARVWRTGYFATRDGQLEASSLEGAQTFLENVRDRLSRTATPTIPDQAFDTARVALSDEMARGSSIRTMSERLGAEFGWSDDVTFWRDRLSDVDGRIDQILDGIGPPGDQAREAARLQDPTVQALRDQRNEAIGRIDADRSRWQVRSERIARTECLPGSAAVTSGRVTAAYRRFYDGQWVTVRLGSGRELSGTPNHPMLTQRGWVGLGELTEHDRVIRHGSQVDRSGAPLDEDVQAPPATIREVFDALAAVGVVERERTGQPDFHGDGLDGYVDVARPDGVLLVGDFAAVNERAMQGVLEGADLRAVALDAFRAPFRRGLAVDERERLGRCAQTDSGLPEDAGDDPLGYVELALKALERPSRLVLLGDVVRWQVVAEPWMASSSEPGMSGFRSAAPLDAPDVEGVLDLSFGESGFGGYGRGADAGEITVDEVVAVRVGHWSGHVYNLSTVDGYFTTGSYYTGNTTGAYNAGAYEAAVDEGAEVKMWISAADDRTRPEHLEANGQCVPMTSDFQVGGVPLAFPGDPSGPPEAVINCRCGHVQADSCEELGAMRDQAEEIARERAHEEALAEEERREAALAD